MLEDLAVDLWSRGESLQGTAFLFFIIGASLAGIASFASRSKSTISRLRYFGYGVMLWAIGQAVVFIVIQMRTEVPNGELWPPTMSLLGASAAIGFYACRLSMSRSRDAFGHGYLAFLGFVPFGILFLWFWPSKKTKVAKRLQQLPAQQYHDERSVASPAS